jgi:L-alanine-DL-glutamate epimerase-like enolase superfamily enzyme
MPRIRNVERIVVQVPFTPRCEEWNPLLVGRWRILEIVRVTTDDPGLVGYGESTYHYTSGNASDAAIERVTGGNPAEFLKDDSLGVDLQMALYDVVGKALGLPVHALLPVPKVRDWAPLGWWNHDMPPEVVAEEAKEAVSKGYLAHKIKTRPWLDVFAQVEAVGAVTPPEYKIDLDWNDMLLNVGNATPVLQELDRYPRVALYEGPIPQRDVEGYQHLRRKVAKPIAIHFGLPPFPTAVRTEMCDGFVVFGGVQAVLQQGILSAAFEKSFFLQQVGTGLTTAMVAHLGAILTHARWPAITCMNNYSDDLLTEPLTIEGGQVRVPEGPGLGVTVDEAALEKYQMEPPYDLPERRHIITVSWPDGRRVHFARMTRPPASGSAPYSHVHFADGSRAEVGRQCWEDFLAGNHPAFLRGVRMDVRKDDGSAEFTSLYERALRGPVRD